MESKDSNQYSKPTNTPNKERPEAKVAGQGEDRNIIDGANQQDQLEKLQPKSEEEKAPNVSGSAPLKKENSGESAE